MRKIILSLFVLALLSSCQKEGLSPNTKPLEANDQLSLTYQLDKIPPLENPQNIADLLKNPLDADDEKINHYLYELSLATRDLVKDPAFNRHILEMARASETQTANLLLLAEVAPRYSELIDQNLAPKGLSIKSIAENLTHRPIAPNPDYPETAEIEKYVPAIFVPNLDLADANLQAIISPNAVVNSDEDESIEDHIIAWYFTEDGRMNEILLNEETAMQTSNPLFLLDNAVTTLVIPENKNAKPLNLDREPARAPDSQLGNERTNFSFASYEHSIEELNYRYEGSGKSEFAVTSARIDENGQQHLVYTNNNGNFREYQVISEIHKDDIGDLRYVWRYHADNWEPWSNPWTPNTYQDDVNMVYWNTFERDWNNSQKPLGSGSASGNTIYLGGNMKYNSEWYAWIPNSVNVHYSRFNWIYDEWAHWNDSWKSRFRLWRVGC